MATQLKSEMGSKLITLRSFEEWLVRWKGTAYLAERLGQTTVFGRKFDAIADTAVSLFVLIFLAVYGYVWWLYALTIILFGIVSASIQYAIILKSGTIMHTLQSRLTMLSTYFFIGASIINFYPAVFFAVSLALTIWRLFDYVYALRNCYANHKVYK